MITDLKENERLDDLGIKGYKIIQNPQQFCFGMDAVLLSEFTQVKEQKRILDLGTGTGILPILLEAKKNPSKIVGLEIQKASADMARRSVEYNKLSHKIDVVEGDLKEASHLFGAASFDVVTCNPPYMINQHGLKNPEGPKAIARHEILCTFEDIARESSKVLTPGGDFYLIHRPFRLTELMITMNTFGLEPKTMRLVYPFADKEPTMVLLHGKKGAKSRIKILEPLIIYKKQGVYTEEIENIYIEEWCEK